MNGDFHENGDGPTEQLVELVAVQSPFSLDLGALGGYQAPDIRG